MSKIEIAYQIYYTAIAHTMNFDELFNNKTIKAKEKTVLLSEWLLSNPKKLSVFISFANTAKDPVKATCIEAIEFATKNNPAIADVHCLQFVTDALTEKAPRVKWEAARVIANIAGLYPAKLNNAVRNLLANTEHPGTVVRWSAATALAQIIQLKRTGNKVLAAAIENICRQEEQNSIKKIYQAALKNKA